MIDLPEEDPSTFSFIIAWLYEGTFTPVKALSSVLGGHAFQFASLENLNFHMALSIQLTSN